MAELDEVLDTIDNAERAIRVPLAHVSGLEPSVRGERLGVELRTLVVTLGDTRSAEPDFTLGRAVGGEVACFGGIDEFDFRRGYGAARDADVVKVRVEDSGHGDTLGQPVALDQDVQAIRHETLGRGAQRTTAAETNLQTASGLSLDGVEDDGIGNGAHPGEAGALELERLVEDSLLDAAGLVDFGEDSLADGFPDGGDADEDRLRRDAVEPSDRPKRGNKPERAQLTGLNSKISPWESLTLASVNVLIFPYPIDNPANNQLVSITNSKIWASGKNARYVSTGVKYS